MRGASNRQQWRYNNGQCPEIARCRCLQVLRAASLGGSLLGSNARTAAPGPPNGLGTGREKDRRVRGFRFAAGYLLGDNACKAGGWVARLEGIWAGRSGAGEG